MTSKIIAVDGPAGAGKSTISKMVAEKLGIEYIDTGAMYRAITLKIIKNKIHIDNMDDINEMLENTKIDLIDGRVFLDGDDVSDAIRSVEVSSMVSEVSAKPEVRQKLVELQRNMAAEKSVIMDGRDIGTNVLKNANYKIFLTASVNERAQRRYKEMMDKCINVTFDEIYKDIEERDRIDSTRKVNPLMKAEDAILIDTTSKTIDEVVNEILSIVKA